VYRSETISRAITFNMIAASLTAALADFSRSAIRSFVLSIRLIPAAMSDIRSCANQVRKRRSIERFFQSLDSEIRPV
jgi:hypothetical protein